MPLERNLDPLPVGIYWIAVSLTSGPSFDAWVRTNPFIKVLKSEQEDPGPITGTAAFTWILFEAEHPTNMPHHFGFPNIAEKGRETEREDTIDEPPPEPGILEELPTIPDIKIGLSVGAVALGLALLAALLYKGRR